MIYYIYVFYDKHDDVIYVGKTINLNQRFCQHSKKTWWKEVSNIYISTTSKLFWDMYEQYYINKFNAKYNLRDINQKYKKLSYPE